MGEASTSTILIVNDREADLMALREALSPLGQPVVMAQSAAEGLSLAELHEIAVAIVDIRMPAVDGFGMVEALRRHPRRGEMPVIFVSALEATAEIERRVYALGAADLVRLPALPEMLRSKVAIFVKLHQQAARERKAAAELRRAATTEVQAQQERFQLLVESVSDYALFFLDPLGLIAEWTVSAERLLGYGPAEAVGEHFRLLFTPEDRARHAPESELQLAVARGQSLDNRLHVRRDGSRVPVNGRTIALKDHEGRLRGFAKIMQDATHIQALRDSEAKFREVFETANEGIWILNADGVIETANRRMAEMLGYSERELIGRRKGDFAFPEDQGYFGRLFEERRSGKIESATEVRFRRKDGTPLRTLLSAHPIFREGKFAGALDMFTDITLRRVAENRFRVFFESSAAGYALLDPVSHHFISVNPRFCEIVGRTSHELHELTFEDITYAADRSEDAARFGELSAGRVKEVSADKRYVRPDGSIVWVHLTTSLVRDLTGKPELQISVVQDITARKQTESELAENRTRLRLAVEAADLGIFYHDGTTGTVTWNEQLKQLVGLRPDEKESVELFLDRIHPDDRPGVDRKIASILRATDGPAEWEMAYRLIRPDGAVRWFKTNGVSEPRLAPNGEILFHSVGTTRDITAEKEFEAELQRQIAERTRELDEKTRQLESFSYTIAHDLRAPLRAINGFADLVLEELEGMQRPKAVDYLERIRNSTHRLDALVSDLLSYSRIGQQPVQIGRVDLDRLVQTVLQELGTDIERSGARVSVQPKLPAVQGEESILEQVMLNLVGNALKFTAPGESPRIDISAADGNGRVRLNVRDRGIGIPAEYHERIFKVFERLRSSRAYPGTGVGLAIVARAMERMGGTYGVESEPGNGSTFWIELNRSAS